VQNPGGIKSAPRILASDRFRGIPNFLASENDIRLHSEPESSRAKPSPL
jgi:hypothetical protein